MKKFIIVSLLLVSMLEAKMESHDKVATLKWVEELPTPEEMYVSLFQKLHPHATKAELNIATSAFRKSLTEYVNNVVKTGDHQSDMQGVLSNKVSVAHKKVKKHKIVQPEVPTPVITKPKVTTPPKISKPKSMPAIAKPKVIKPKVTTSVKKNSFKNSSKKITPTKTSGKIATHLPKNPFANLSQKATPSKEHPVLSGPPA